MRGGHGDLHPPPGEGGAQGGVVAGRGRVSVMAATRSIINTHSLEFFNSDTSVIHLGVGACLCLILSESIKTLLFFKHTIINIFLCRIASNQLERPC